MTRRDVRCAGCNADEGVADVEGLWCLVRRRRGEGQGAPFAEWEGVVRGLTSTVDGLGRRAAGGRLRKIVTKLTGSVEGGVTPKAIERGQISISG